MTVRLTEPAQAAALFGDWQETLIWSCTQGVMGEVYADAPDAPRSARAELGDFSFFAGRPEEELVRYWPEGRPPSFHILVPQNEAWASLIERCYAGQAKQTVRYAIRKEPDRLDRRRLEKAVRALPLGYTLRGMDELCYRLCLSQDWSRDLVSNYRDYERYRSLGLGVVALREGQVVAGASAYSRYREGIEIEIDTERAHRRRGLAYACAARLMLDCLERGLYPSWDAQNLPSVALAEKLGYRFDHTYPVYELLG